VTAKKTGKATKKPAKKTGESKNKPTRKTGESKQKPAKTEAPAASAKRRNTAEQALRESEERYRTLVESAPDGIVIHVGDRVAFANRAAAALLGFAGPAALVGRPLASFVHPADLANAAERVRKVLAGEAVAYPVEVRYVRRDGTGLPVENTGALVSYKGKPAILSVIRDITERKRAEEALKNSLSLVEATLETTDNGILVVNREGAVVKANRRFAEMWRIPGDILASGDDKRLLNHVLSQLSNPDAFVAKVKALYGDPVAESADLLFFKDGRIFERSSKPMLVGGEPTARVWSFLDVTDRKRAEEALRKSEEEYRGLTEHINLGIYRNTVGHEGKFIEANPAIIGMFGYGSKAGFLSMNVSDLYQNPEDRNAFNDKMLKEGFVRGEELWLKKKDGSLFVGSVSAVAVKDERGQVEYYDGIIDDITERKRTEDALRASEERFRTLYEDSTIGIYRTTPDGRIQLANPALIRMLGYSSFDDLSTRSLEEEDYEPSYSRRQFVEIIERDGEVKGLESAWKRKDGTTFFARESARAIRDSQANTLYYDGTIEDITERKRAEEALRESEEKFSRAFLTSPYAITITGAEDGKFLEVNDAFTSMTGFTREEALADSAIGLRLWINEDDRLRALSALGAGRAVAGREFQFRMKSGDVITGLFSAQVLRLGQHPCILSSIADITDRKRAEEALRIKDWAIESATNAIVTSDLEGNLNYVNPAFLKLWGYGSPAEVLGKPAVEFWHMGEKAAEVAKAVRASGGWIGELVAQRKDGALFDVHVASSLVLNDAGQPVCMQASFADITERKRAEEALAQERFLLQAFMNNVPDHVYFKDRDSRFIRINKAQAQAFGMSDPAQAIGKTDFDFFTEEQARQAREDELAIIRTGQPANKEERETWAGRRDTWVSTTKVPLRDEEGNVVGTFGISRDITERKRAEEALRLSEERHRTILQTAMDGFWITDRQGQLLDANDAYCQMSGYSAPELLAMRVTDLEIGHTASEIAARIQTNMAQGGEDRFESRHRRKDGSVFEVEISIQYQPTDGGRLVAFLRDITDRKRAEAALRETEARYRRITEGLTDYQYTVRVEHGCAVETTQGPACARVTGYTAEEYAADPYLWIRMVTPEDRERVREHVRLVLAGEDVPSIEHRIVRKDGAVRWVSDTAIPHKDASGRLLSYDGVISDITGRKRAEEELRQAEERMELFFSQSLDGCFFGMLDEPVHWNDSADKEKVLDYVFAHQRVTKVNDAILAHYGVTREQLIGRTPNETFAHDIACGRRVWRKRFDAGRSHDDTEERKLDGTKLLIEGDYICMYDSEGRITGYFGAQRDITEQRRAEDELRRMESVVRCSSELISLSTLDGKMIFLNEAGSGMLGISPAEVEHFNIMQFIPAHLKEKVETELLPAVMGAGTWAGELQYLKLKTGQLTDVHAMVFVVRDPATGAPLHLANVSLDITDRKRAEEEVRQKAKDLQEMNEELARFTYAVSHDLRSPLVTIQTFQGYLEQDVRNQDAARTEKDLLYIRNAADKMGLLLDELLRLSRVGRVTNPPEEAPLQSIVKEALDLVAGRLTARGVRVEVTEEPVVLTGDRTRLVEVFQNLVDNATKFMGDEPAPRVEIGVEQAGEELVLFVRDNGIGIEPQLQPLVFGLFRKLDPGTDGVGIGLALVRRIVELHGGRIWVESEGLGKGTTFRLTLAQTTRKRD